MIDLKETFTKIRDAISELGGVDEKTARNIEMDMSLDDYTAFIMSLDPMDNDTSFNILVPYLEKFKEDDKEQIEELNAPAPGVVNRQQAYGAAPEQEDEDDNDEEENAQQDQEIDQNADEIERLKKNAGMK